MFSLAGLRLQPSKGRTHDTKPVWSNAVGNESSNLAYIAPVRVLGHALQGMVFSV